MAQDLANYIPALKYKAAQLKLRDLEGGGGSMAPGANIFYVDSVSGSSVNGGERPDKALATIDQGISLAAVRANKGDVIAVLPGHQENIAAATSLVADVAGLRIVGFGEGRAQPELTWTATAGTIEMDAVSCSLENLLFLTSVSAVVVGINIDAADCSIVGCKFDFDATGDDFLIGVDPATSGSRFSFLNNNFIAEDTAGAADGIRLNDSDFYKINGNFFTGNWSNAPIRSLTGVSSGSQIRDNYVVNTSTTAGDGCILIATADTGICANNYMGSGVVGTGADSALFDPGSLYCIGNRLARGVDKAGYIVPVGSLTGGRALEWRLAKVADSAFDGGTANAHGNDAGTDDPHTVFTVTGDILIDSIWGICNTSLTGATATISVGVTGNTAGLLALETATEIVDGNVYVSATQAVGVAAVANSGAPVALNDGFDVLEYVATANVTGGQIDYYCVYAPCEDGAILV